MWPHISDADQAYNAVAACRYPRMKDQPIYSPAGIRGDGPTTAARYWGLGQQDYYKKADVWPLSPEGEIFCILMIEDVKAMVKKVDFVIDDRAEAAGYHLMTTYIDVELNDGRTVSGQADFGKGSPAFPMSYDEVAGKFRENAEFAGMGRGRAEEIVELVRGLERLASLDDLSSRLISV